jgi:hypothetical protein
MGNAASIAFDRSHDRRAIEHEYPSTCRIVITVLSLVSILMFTSAIKETLNYLIVADLLRIYVLLIIFVFALLVIALLDRICVMQVEKQRVEKEAEMKFGLIRV